MKYQRLDAFQVKRLSTAMLLVAAATTANAQLATNMAIDIRALSLGNAVTADPPGINSIHYNPAGLTQVQGLQTDVNTFLLDMGIEREFSAPKGFNVFGYSDDPIVCNDKPNDGNRLCSDFKNYAKSEAKGIALFVPGLDEMIDLPAGIPVGAGTAGIAYRPPGSKAVFGTAAYPIAVAGLYHEEGDPAKYMGDRLALERITYLSPTIAYEVDDNLSVGLSVGLSYQAIAMETVLRTPTALLGVARLVDEDICAPFKEAQNLVTDLLLLGMCRAREGAGPFKPLGELEIGVQETASPSFNVGVLWEPTDDLAFGLVYQSKGDTFLQGKFKLRTAEPARELVRGMNSSITGQIVLALLNFPSYVPEVETGKVILDLDYPAHFQAGIKYKVTPDLQVNLDFGYSDFDEWSNWKIQFDRQLSVLRIARLLSPEITPTSLNIPIGLRSSWSWGVGIEQRVSDRVKLRLGYEPRNSAVPLNKRNPMIPINNAQLFGTGLEYQFDPDTTLDLTAAYIRSRDKIPANTSSFANTTGVNNLVLNPYAGLDIKTKTDVYILGMAYRTRW